MKVVIVIPAYNEEKTIGGVVSVAKQFGKVIVINDASSDNTAPMARKYGATVISHAKNMGLGASIRDGFKEALRNGADFVITLDADGQHDPKDIPRLIEKLNESYDFVLGERNLSRYPFTKKFGNFFLNLATNLVSGTAIRDTESGFRAIKSEALKNFYLRAERYEIAVEIIFEVGKQKLKTANVPISSPVYVKGVGVLDGVKNFRYLIKRRKRNLKSYVDDFKYVAKNFIGAKSRRN